MGYLAYTGAEDCDPNKVVCPFDKKRSGTILSEGASFLVLETREHAEKRGAEPLAQVLGFGQAADCRFGFVDNETPRSLKTSVVQALSETVSLDRLGVIVSHTNGSVHGDIADMQAFRSFLGESTCRVPITSPKAVLGEMDEAGGVVNVINAIDILRAASIPPTHNLQQIDAAGEGLCISAQELPCVGNHALITSRGFSGISCSLVIGRVA